MIPAVKPNPLVDFVKQSMDLEDAAEIARRADVLEGMGYERTAGHLREHATRLRVGSPRRRAEAAALPALHLRVCRRHRSTWDRRSAILLWSTNQARFSLK